jgi:dihydrofolate synthase / folylpolyglutamate synthase
MNYDEAVRSLLSLGRELAAPRQARLQKFGLDNITALAAALGNPQGALPCVHIAGTNGKGSTAAMLESVLRAAGVRTGLYTSPHLERINERIRIDGQDISDEEFAALWTRVQAAVESLLASGGLSAHATFFECVTAMAFLAFAESGMGCAVYEVGMGGRFDATNIVQPEVAVITPIDFDHENFLGHSIEEIAGEKAGIIKLGAWVVSAAERPEARAVIARRCEELGARLFEVDQNWRIEREQSADGCYRALAAPVEPLAPASARATLAIEPGLPGRFQIRNALAAATAAKLLAERGFPIGDEAIMNGIAKARWPGRLERLSERPTVYLDGTHNPAGASEVRKFWEENFKGRRIVLVYAAMRDKAVDEIAGLLFPRADAVILTEPRQARALSASVLADMAGHLANNVSVVRDPTQALEQALEMAGPEDAVFATGSLYLVGDLRAYWGRRKASKAPQKKPAVPARPRC